MGWLWRAVVRTRSDVRRPPFQPGWTKQPCAALRSTLLCPLGIPPPRLAAPAACLRR
jgi:hypothetical protein